MKSVLMTMQATEDWRDAVNSLAADLGVSQSTLIGEAVRLLATLKGVRLPDRAVNPSPRHGKTIQSLDFSALDLSRLQN